MNNLSVFDLDETLFKTSAKVHVLKDGKIKRKLNNQEFNSYIPQEGETFDFLEFTSADLFLKTSIPIRPMIGRLREKIRQGNQIRILTARKDFDKKEIFLKALKVHGINPNHIHVDRAGNIPGPSHKSKEIFFKKYFNIKEFKVIEFFDDHEENLKTFKGLSDLTQSKLKAFLVRDGLSISY